mgnify:CR=1 FL=1|tara:strand:+ start:1948 stop:3336 length:1389 start_codon:yes stop_codon:yes gene_type:complete
MKNSVIRVLVSPIAPSQLGPVFAGLTSGTAFFIQSPLTEQYDKLHFLFTNFHVVASGGSININMHGKNYPCKMVAAVPTEDLALLQVEKKILDFKPKPLELYEQNIQPMTAVTAYGFPNGRPEMNITTGHVSSVFMTNGHELVSHSCVLETGNSGGPLVEAETGKVISINSMITERENLSLPAYRMNMFLKPMLQSPVIKIDINEIPEIVKQLWAKHEIGGRLALSDGTTRPVAIEEWATKEAVKQKTMQEIFEHMKTGQLMKAIEMKKNAIKMPQQKIFNPLNTTIEFTPSAFSPAAQEYYGIQGIGVIIGSHKLGLEEGDLLTHINDQPIDQYGYVGNKELNMILRKIAFDETVQFKIIKPGGNFENIQFQNAIHDRNQEVHNFNGIILSQIGTHATVVGITPECKAFQSLTITPGHRLMAINGKKDFNLKHINTNTPTMMKFEHPTTLRPAHIIIRKNT